MKLCGHRALLENCQVSKGKCLKLLPISCNSPACELSLSSFKRDWLQDMQLAEARTLQGLFQASSQGHTLLTTSGPLLSLLGIQGLIISARFGFSLRHSALELRGGLGTFSEPCCTLWVFLPTLLPSHSFHSYETSIW